jgi:hypothetical protein
MSDFDPTTNCIPFGMLSKNEQLALQGWPHGWELYGIDGWSDAPLPCWMNYWTYRGKPAPVVTSRWFNIFHLGPRSHPYPTLESTNKACGADCRIAVLRIDTCNGVSTAHLEDI